MGLFDMFGAGGGALQIQVMGQATSGGTLTGNLVFTGGKRAQNVTNIAIRMSMDQRSMQMTPQGPQQRTDSRDIVPRIVVTQTFSSTPGQPSTFPFQMTIPGGLPSTTQGVVTYHLRASADIDNEPDPGASQEIQVMGTGPAVAQGMPGQMMPGQGMPGQMMPGQMMPGQGMPGQMMPGQMMPGQGMPGQMMPGQMPGQGMPGQMMPGMAGVAGMVAGVAGMAGMAQGMAPGMAQGMAPGMGQGMAPGMAPQQLAIGTRVMAIWTDGQYHPARIQFAQNGVYYVDWEEAHLGQTSPVYPQQLQIHPQQHAAAPVAAYAAQPAPVQKAVDPYAQQAAKHDPYAAKGGVDPYAAKGVAPGGAVAVGAAVMAQHPSNQQWYPGRVASVQNGMIGVDWDDPAMGASSWVMPAAVQPR